MERRLSLINDECNGCFSCASKCPYSCIKMVTNTEGFLYPKIDTEKCIGCGLCEKACPIITGQTQKNFSSDALAVINKDEKIRASSSSGGVFTLLAEQILDDGGVVFGAAFSNDFKKVFHIAIEKKEDLSHLQGSKYLQSNINDSYIKVKDYLTQNRKVLFSGTPCQIAGLYAFLGKKNKNLLTQDIICHGVPSPLVWEKYLAYRENIAKSKIKQVFFRSKQNNWVNYSLKCIFADGSEYVKSNSEDLYLRGFANNLFLRPSCHKCAFKSENRVSDITLADFWGIENVSKEKYDTHGVSLVLLNTDNGRVLFENIKRYTDCCFVDKAKALYYNPSATSSSVESVKRNEFMSDLNNKSFEKVIKKYCGKTFSENIKKFIKTCFPFANVLRKKL